MGYRPFDNSKRNHTKHKRAFKMMTNRRISLGFCIALASVLFVLPQPLFAGFTIDPGNVGATDVSPADPANWTESTYAYIGDGYGHSGFLLVDGGSDLLSHDAWIGYSNGPGVVTIDGPGSTWNVIDDLRVVYFGQGALSITNGGLVSVGGTLTINYFEFIGIAIGDSESSINDPGYNNSINMATGGMLALNGGNEGDTLADFLGPIQGYGTICYWNETNSSWKAISNATYGEDYTLTYHDSGDLAGYTVLTVGTVPEPGCMGLFLTLLAAGIGFLSRKQG